MKLDNYLQDGAGHQAKGVLAYLQNLTIEESWNTERRKYDAELSVARWENCREQGYVVWLTSSNYKRQLNIAFFEHRNSDNIHAVRWEQVTFNSPTIDTAQFGEVYKDKYDTSHSVRYGEVLNMSDWIGNQFNEFWDETQREINSQKDLEI